jgi:twitching motility protein PilU
MDRLMAEGSQTFEQDIARLVTENLVTRDEGILHADSPTNLLWRLQNDMASGKRQQEEEQEAAPGPSFTEITLDVVPGQSHQGRGSFTPSAAPMPTGTTPPPPPSTAAVKPLPFLSKKR